MGLGVRVWLLSVGDARDFGVGGSARRGVSGETGEDNGDVALGRECSPVMGISDRRCLFLNLAMNPFRPGPAEAGGLGIGTLNLPKSVALESLGAPGGFSLAGS